MDRNSRGPRQLKIQLLLERQLRPLRATHVIAIGAAVTAGTVLAQAVGQWIDFRVFHLSMKVLDSNHHASIFGAVSILAQTGAAVAIALRAAQPNRHRFLWLSLGVLVAVLVFVRTFAAYDAILLLPPLAAVFGLLSALTLRDPLRVRVLVSSSLAMLALSLVLHSVGLAANATSSALPWTSAYQLTAMLKHGAELAGWMLLATAMAATMTTPSASRSNLALGRPATG